MRAAARDARVEVVVHDDGVGGADPSRGSGPIGLSDRVAAVSGTLAITSPPGRGTTITASIPLPAPQDAQDLTEAAGSRERPRRSRGSDVI